MAFGIYGCQIAAVVKLIQFTHDNSNNSENYIVIFSEAIFEENWISRLKIEYILESAATPITLNSNNVNNKFHYFC